MCPEGLRLGPYTSHFPTPCYAIDYGSIESNNSKSISMNTKEYHKYIYYI